MAAYYNEIDPKAAAWLRELIKRQLIAPGEVDERSILDVHPADLAGFVQCHFFAGIGVWSYALRCAGWSDDRPVWTGSCPCQPFSAAGKRAGVADERHLWPAFHHLIAQRRPGVVFGEQVEAAIKLGWLDLVQSDLEGIGYVFAAFGLPAACVGACHIRQRLYFVADTNSTGLQAWHVAGQSRPQEVASAWCEFERVHAAGTWAQRETESDVPVFADGPAERVGLIRGFGNAIVAPVAQEFIEAYMTRSDANC